jgi:hypothetical protein
MRIWRAIVWTVLLSFAGTTLVPPAPAWAEVGGCSDGADEVVAGGGACDGTDEVMTNCDDGDRQTFFGGIADWFRGLKDKLCGEDDGDEEEPEGTTPVEPDEAKPSQTIPGWTAPRDNDRQARARKITMIVTTIAGVLLGWHMGILPAIVGGGLGLLVGAFLAGEWFPDRALTTLESQTGATGPRTLQLNFPWFDITNGGQDPTRTGLPGQYRFQNLAELQRQYYDASTRYKDLLKASGTASATDLEKARDDYVQKWRAFMDAQKSSAGAQ